MGISRLVGGSCTVSPFKSVEIINRFRKYDTFLGDKNGCITLTRSGS
jgi:hypothetical protein